MSHKTVIIPDIHNKWKTAEQIIKNEDPDLTIFLGDYFDGFGDDAASAAKTAQWLAESIRSSHNDDANKRIHIIGNHDLHYMTDNVCFRCSGYTRENRDAIRSCNIDWDRMHLYYWLEDGKEKPSYKNSGWLCTHAGFTNALFEQQRIASSKTVRDVLRDGARTDISNIHIESTPHPFLQAGYLRGGPSNTTGGIVWCDYEEFEDIPHTKQIFGHTRGPKVRHGTSETSEHYCIDTVLHNYAVCKDYDAMTIKNTDMQEA